MLFLTTKYSKSILSPWLTSELAEELIATANDVTVLCLDWQLEGEKGVFEVNGITIFNYPAISCKFGPSVFRKAIKWIISSVCAYSYFKTSLKGRNFDALISFSPCMPVWFCIFKLRQFAIKRIVIYWDFFPIHQFQIGKFRSKLLLKPAYWLEKFLLSTFDSAGCMSAMNVDFFNNYFSLGSKVKTFELPVWGKMYMGDNGEIQDPSLRRAKFAYKKLVVFGGQLERGRGIDKLLLLAKQLRERNEDIAVVIAGDGPLKSEVVDALQGGLHNLIYLGKIPRTEYLQFIRTCDIGIVATQMDVSVPTYPSKCIDYLLAPLPIIAFVEKSTDFGSIIQESGCGLVCSNDSISELADKVASLAHNEALMAEMRLACSVFFERRHDVVRVAKLLLKEL